MSEWLERAYEAVDRKDAAGFAELLTEGVRFRFGNAEPIVGRDAVRESLEGFFAAIEGVSHRFRNVWQVDDHLILVPDAEYTRRDSRRVTIPAVTIYELEGDLAKGCEIFMDLAPLFAETTEPAAVAG